MLAELPLYVLSEMLGVRGFVAAAAGFCISIAAMYVMGRFGHRWLAWSLRRQGYVEMPG
jgi:putative flippase GtrA